MAKPINNSREVVYYLPYLGFYGDQEICGFHFWNFDKCKSEYIKDSTVLEYLDKYFSRIVDQTLQPIEGICIVDKLELKALSEWPDEIKDDLFILLDCLAFELIRNRDESPHEGYVAENFTVGTLPINTKDDYISTKSGSYISYLNAGCELDESYFQRPIFVPNMRINKFDLYWDLSTKVNKALLEINNRRKSDETDKNALRVLRAIQIFNQAHLNYDLMGSAIRLANYFLLTSAMEILIGESQGRKEFVKNLMSFLFPEWFETEVKILGMEKGENFKIETSESFLAEFFDWAKKYYRIRNDIFHGNRTSNADLFFNDSSHFKIGRAVFSELLEKKLENMGIHRRFIGIMDRTFQFTKYFSNEYNSKYERANFHKNATKSLNGIDFDEES